MTFAKGDFGLQQIYKILNESCKDLIDIYVTMMCGCSLRQQDQDRRAFSLVFESKASRDEPEGLL